MRYKSEKYWKGKDCPVNGTKCKGQDCALWVWNDCPDNCVMCDFVNNDGEKYEDLKWWQKWIITDHSFRVWSCPEYEFKKELIPSDCEGCKYRFGRCGLTN